VEETGPAVIQQTNSSWVSIIRYHGSMDYQQRFLEYKPAYKGLIPRHESSIYDSLLPDPYLVTIHNRLHISFGVT